jgi:hypothetical protein
MDANGLRARFIKRQLQRALGATDMTFAGKAAREFRRYVGWFKQLLSERDKKRIATQLSMLENKVRGKGGTRQQVRSRKRSTNPMDVPKMSPVRKGKTTSNA